MDIIDMLIMLQNIADSEIENEDCSFDSDCGCEFCNGDEDESYEDEDDESYDEDESYEDEDESYDESVSIPAVDISEQLAECQRQLAKCSEILHRNFPGLSV